MEQRLIQHLDGRLSQLEEKLGGKISELTSSIDRYLKRTEEWHDEFNVLKARYEKLVHALDRKGVILEEETHLA